MNGIRLTQPHQGEHYVVGTDVVTIRAGSQDTGGTLLVVEVRVPPGGGPPALHRHPSAKTFRFLAGEFELTTLNDQHQPGSLRARSGDTVSIPGMTWHNIRNVGTETGHYVGVHSPPLLEPLIRELGQPIDNPLALPLPNGPLPAAERPRMMRAIGQYMEFWPPVGPTPL